MSILSISMPLVVFWFRHLDWSLRWPTRPRRSTTDAAMVKRNFWISHFLDYDFMTIVIIPIYWVVQIVKSIINPYLSIYPSIYPSIHLSINLSIDLSINLHINQQGFDGGPLLAAPLLASHAPWDVASAPLAPWAPSARHAECPTADLAEP